MKTFKSLRHTREILVADWQDGEELAAWYMRTHLGMDDAARTRVGADGGVDVNCSSAAAQVKHLGVPVGSPTVQGAVGAARGKKALFFSLSGYTTQARVYAREVGACLFSYDIYGEVVPIGTAAQRVLADAVAGSTATTVAGRRLAELHAKAAPAIHRLAQVDHHVDAFALELEQLAGWEEDEMALGWVIAQYANFFPRVDRATQLIRVLEKQLLAPNQPQITYLLEGIELMLELRRAIMDVERLRMIKPPGWLRILHEWAKRKNRAMYLISVGQSMRVQPGTTRETIELNWAIETAHAAFISNPITNRWLSGGGPFTEAAGFAVSLDRIGKRVMPLGWSDDEADRIAELAARIRASLFYIPLAHLLKEYQLRLTLHSCSHPV